MSDKRALFFCSASFDIDPKFNDVAADVVRSVAEKGYDVVSGGTIKGTMNVVADTAADCGVGNIGVIPRFMESLVHPRLTETIWTDTMAERKEGMREGVSLVIALPGGIGTLDELMETLTLVKLERMDAKIIAMNCYGFYEPLKNLLDHYLNTGMLDERSRALISFPSTVEEFKEMI